MKPSMTCQMLFTLAVISLLLSAPHADTPKPQTLVVEDNQHLVTVKDGDGTWLFSQVSESPSLKVLIVKQNSQSVLLTLSDASGKVLWSKPLDPKTTFTITGGWQAKCPTLPLQSAPSQTSGEQEKGNDDDDLKTISYMISSENQPLSIDVTTNKHHASFKFNPNSPTLLLDIDGKKSGIQIDEAGKNGIAFVNGKQYPFHEIKRDDKTYQDINLSGQHILIPTDLQWQFDQDGEMILATPPTVGTTVQAPATP